MAESSYSSLCEPLLEPLKKIEDSAAPTYKSSIEAYRTFLDSLELQHAARVADLEATTEAAGEVEREISSLKTKLAEQDEELGALRATISRQKHIAHMAKQRFEQPVEVHLERTSETRSVVLNKTAAQLDEDHKFLEEQAKQLEEELVSKRAELDRRSVIAEELMDFVSDAKERFARGDDDRHRSHDHAGAEASQEPSRETSVAASAAQSDRNSQSRGASDVEMSDANANEE